MNNVKNPLPSWLLLTIGIVAISFSSIFIRWSESPVSVLGMYRMLLTALLMLPVVIALRSEWRSVSGLDWALLALSGLFLFLHFLFWMGSLRYTTVANSTVLMTLEPIFVLAGAVVWFRERTTGAAVCGMLAAVAGAVWMGWGDIGVSARALTGDVMSIAGTAAVAVHMLFGQLLRRRISSTLYSFSVFVSAGACFAVYNAALGVPFGGYPPSEWLLFGLLAVVPTVFGHILFNWMLRFVNASTVSMSVLGEPVGATLLAALLLDEPLRAVQLASGVLIIAGVWIFLRFERQAA